MRAPDREEPCWNHANCGNIVPFICDDVSREPGELPRASYVVKCIATVITLTTLPLCGHPAKDVCHDCGAYLCGIHRDRGHYIDGKWCPE